MARRDVSFLLIPGTGGVNFSNALGERASFVVEVVHGRFGGWTDRLVRELGTEHPPSAEPPWAPVRTTLLDDAGELVPRDVLYASAYPPVPRTKYRPFAYDWRLDIRYNALLLLEYLAAQDEPVGILAHSQGALVALAASLLCRDADEWHSVVGRICLVAPPLVGTVRAMQATTDGRNYANTNSAFFRAVSRIWPALMQMYPQWDVVANDSALRSTSRELWPAEGADFHALLARADDYMAFVDAAPFRNVRPDRLMVVLGRSARARTPVRVERTASVPRVLPDVEEGDGVVPYARTFDLLSRFRLGQRTMIVRGAHQPEHFRLLGDPRIYQDCDRFLSLP